MTPDPTGVERAGDLVYDVPAGCDACRYGDRECRAAGVRVDRAGGAGRADAPIMLVAEFPRDADAGGGPFGVRRATARDSVDPSSRPVRAAMAAAGIPPSDVYSTHAIKCEPPEREVEGRHRVPKRVRRTCLVEHLGVEIETVRPSAIWLTGYRGVRMVREHFPGADVPELSDGQVSKVEAPPDWGSEEMLVAKSVHPSAVDIGTGDPADLGLIANLVSVYVSDSV